MMLPRPLPRPINITESSTKSSIPYLFRGLLPHPRTHNNNPDSPKHRPSPPRARHVVKIRFASPAGTRTFPCNLPTVASSAHRPDFGFLTFMRSFHAGFRLAARVESSCNLGSGVSRRDGHRWRGIDIWLLARRCGEVRD